MTPEEKIAAKTTARIIRAARKKLGVTQTELANHLGISQSAICKIEKGQLIPSVYQWFEFCKMTHISPESHLVGYIDSSRAAVLATGKKVGSFTLPSRYAENRGSTARSLLPFLIFSKEKLGEEGLRTYLKDVKLDPDFFVNLDSQISINFVLDLSRYLIQTGYLNSSSLGNLAHPVNQPEAHGALRAAYDAIDSTRGLLESFVSHAAYYDCDFKYRFEENKGKRVVLSVKPERHLVQTAYKGDAVLGDFLCKYRKKYLERFSVYGGNRRMVLDEVQCHHKGAPKCVYRISLTA